MSRFAFVCALSLLITIASCSKPKLIVPPMYDVCISLADYKRAIGQINEASKAGFDVSDAISELSPICEYSYDLT